MAPGPRVRIAESIEVLDKGNEYIWDDDAESVIDDDDDVRPPLRYYKSQRVLGALYRMINEKDFVNELEWDSSNRQPQSKSVNVLASVWEYVERETAGFLWDHCVKDAHYVRDVYVFHLRPFYIRNPFILIFSNRCLVTKTVSKTSCTSTQTHHGRVH